MTNEETTTSIPKGKLESLLQSTTAPHQRTKLRHARSTGSTTGHRGLLPKGKSENSTWHHSRWVRGSRVRVGEVTVDTVKRLAGGCHPHPNAETVPEQRGRVVGTGGGGGGGGAIIKSREPKSPLFSVSLSLLCFYFLFLNSICFSFFLDISGMGSLSTFDSRLGDQNGGQINWHSLRSSC